MSIALFEENKQINEYDQPYWTARDMCKILGYSDYRNFLKVVEKGRLACKNSGQEPSDHFVEFNEMIQTGKGAKRLMDNIKLSRYACYLMVQNADPSKQIVAQGQTYFATQTRKQEAYEARKQLADDQRRMEVRSEMAVHNKKLIGVARQAGVVNYGQFQDAGYIGLYGGLRKKQLAEKKGLDPEETILDYMSSEELGANLFRATQTEAKLKRELEEGRVLGQDVASTIHHDVGKKVRQTIQELGGTMPEELPLAEHIREVEKRLKEMKYDDPMPLTGDNAGIGESSYMLPANVSTLQDIIQIIKSYPGEEIIRLGDGVYKVSSQGKELLMKLLD
ncbi:MAG: DNA damage-inducible protein D [Candidatus Absconditabacterales bacterium]